MNVQIHSILLYGKNIEQPRVLPFKLGAVNIITGESGTGKSSIIHILDYCLGRSTFNVFEGVNRDRVLWYGVVLQIEQQQSIIVKPAPEGHAASQSRAYWDVAAVVTVPAQSELVLNSNDEAIKRNLSGLVGISENQTVVAEGRTTPSFEATFDHTKYYLFQNQGTIANEKLLFWRQAEPIIPTHIKDTMKYFLGAIQEERLRLEQEYKLATRELKLLLQRQRTAGNALNNQLENARTLFAEAKAAGMVRREVLDGELLAELRVLAGWTAQEVVGAEGTPLADVQANTRRLRQAASELRQRLREAENFVRNVNGYHDQASEQALRLHSVAFYQEGSIEANKCALCEQTLVQPTPSTDALNNALNQLNVSIEQVQQDRLRAEEHIVRLTEELATLQEQVNISEERAKALTAAQLTAQRLKDSNFQAAHVAGQITFFLRHTEVVAEDTTLRREIELAQRRVDDLAERLSAEQVEDVMVSIINVLGVDMTTWAGQLQLEPIRFSPSTRYRLDYKNLTVIADTPERGITMERLGSAANWLGCHLIALLALHKFFIERQRPVPSFLVLDQPSQVYFPSQASYQELRGEIGETTAASTDIQAVTRIFDLLFRVVQELAPNFQVIVLEHANLDDPRYQEALVEAPWVNGRALIPTAWLQ
jgi:hypothetical protein